ncbi:glutamine--scyllo-inositol transaminase [Candidatus Desulfofervidus auxilii]|uniref:Glutamine--scyllo-inositol transaminase n=1 Tax=Desulfofervidus auxilii TaxID=1621989 RepID=A0A7U4QKD5_DESA2|nr:DegT/DnrJ/EryC1/StrS family aminotransferase [Candidatus Desulfofervidus auxilii]AMM40955.1 glutamine--scyllo-inositol transaminase [Candidatus Desulfofervidus auxilii]
MNIPLLDLKIQYQSIKSEIKQALDKVLESQHFILNGHVETLEKKIAHYCGCDYAIGVSSGSDALLVSLMAIDIQPGDEVITVPYTFFATVGSIVRLGAKPVFVDIELDTFNIDVNQIEEKITPRTKAVIPVHLFGQCCEMQAIIDIARKYNLKIIEDAAQAIGAEYKQKKTGSLGDIGCFSFFPSKNLGGYGDGGMVVTKVKPIYEKIKMLRVHGASSKYYHKLIGGNFRLDELQAAILLVKFKYLDAWNKKRAECAQRYYQLFSETGLLDFIIPPKIKQSNHVFHQYVVRVQKRDQLLKYLKTQGIGCAIYYPLPLHLQESLSSLGYKRGDFPQTERASKETLALPMYPELTIKQQEYIVKKIRDFYNQV